mmetsp:Transcript_19713/g.45361  ORF Transcript_19713/g.45361 Transcript_19713/m.45361 type:complete len:228 (-) Transcript_19713:2890-3573(-)
MRIRRFRCRCRNRRRRRRRRACRSHHMRWRRHQSQWRSQSVRRVERVCVQGSRTKICRERIGARKWQGQHSPRAICHRTPPTHCGPRMFRMQPAASLIILACARRRWPRAVSWSPVRHEQRHSSRLLVQGDSQSSRRPNLKLRSIDNKCNSCSTCTCYTSGCSTEELWRSRPCRESSSNTSNTSNSSNSHSSHSSRSSRSSRNSACPRCRCGRHSHSHIRWIICSRS